MKSRNTFALILVIGTAIQTEFSLLGVYIFVEVISELEVVQQGGGAVVEFRRALIRVHGIVELISICGKSDFINFLVKFVKFFFVFFFLRRRSQRSL